MREGGREREKGREGKGIKEKPTQAIEHPLTVDYRRFNKIKAREITKWRTNTSIKSSLHTHIENMNLTYKLLTSWQTKQFACQEWHSLHDAHQRSPSWAENRRGSRVQLLTLKLFNTIRSNERTDKFITAVQLVAYGGDNVTGEFTKCPII